MTLPIKVEVDAKVGEQSSDKLIDAIVDAFSPATETLGLIGDAVRLARVSVAAKITNKAKQIAVENGLQLTTPPLKFLVPFYEKASLEDPADESLIDMWARLLTSAASQYQDRIARFTSILAELGKTQADLLDRIANNYDNTILNIDEAALFYYFRSANLIDEIQKLETFDPAEALQNILDQICLPGICVEIVQIDPAGEPGNLFQWADDPVFLDKFSVDLQILHSLGLLSTLDTGFFQCKSGFAHVNLYCFTELGFEFWKACSVGRFDGQRGAEVT
ncbi:DUF4393 domain-containing protein [Rhizobium leguminosarum]|uniref:Abi-alpha family protein n=1 Tax=Rhizobium leguminosarum TaxID=384 RepID=UPI000FEEC24A|nr:Abi-alpha family protein [Rhizobium leguminosarum]RWY82394.1 DUF4393 domain-containing protein [Rhizobium leguminosarum]